MAGGGFGQRVRRLVGAALLSASVLLVGFLAGTGAASLGAHAGLWGDSSASEQQHQQESQPQPSNATVAYTAWDEQESPNYYRVVGPAQVGTQVEAGTVSYGSLDALGRATGAVACVTHESMEAGMARERADTSQIEPTGWGHNDEVDIAMPNGTVYHGFLFNRSHLVAKSLGGDDELHNLICATRTQNVGANVDGSEGGMAYCEGLVRNWLDAHPQGSVYYAAAPAYEGAELVARSVIVDLRSDDGTLDQRVEVYNAARGFEIDYATGTFRVTEDAEQAADEIRGQTQGEEADGSAGNPSDVAPEAEDGERQVIVTGSGKAYHHDETCSGLVNARSMDWVSVSEAERMGRHPCGICGG